MALQGLFLSLGSNSSLLVFPVFSSLSELRRRLDEASDELLKVHEEVKTRLDELSEKEVKWAALEARIDEEYKKAASKVVFDVGGTRFATSKSTLVRIKGTYFDALISSGRSLLTFLPQVMTLSFHYPVDFTLGSFFSPPVHFRWKPDQDGVYFIDRDPKYFGIILDYLRDESLVDFNVFNSVERARLQKDLDYFLITLPPPTFAQPVGSKLSLSHDYKIVTKTSGSGWDSGSSAVTSIPITQFLKVRVVKTANIMVGLAPLPIDHTQSALYSKRGWYVNSNGTCYNQGTGATHKSNISSFRFDGAIIELQIDSVSKSIFAVYQEKRTEIYANLLTTEKLYGVIEIADVNGSVELLEAK